MIEHIILSDVEENKFPTPRRLRLAVVEDTIFLAICDVKDGHKEGEYGVLADGKAQIAINAYDFLESLQTLAKSNERS
jgi:hypothetical protein